MSWLVKRRHYDGGESVIGHWSVRGAAQTVADDMNDQYQTDNYYVEEYDPAKSEWPDE